jgi:hypothetical protein
VSRVESCRNRVSRPQCQRVFGDVCVSVMYRFGEHRAVFAYPAGVGPCGHHPSSITTFQHKSSVLGADGRDFESPHPDHIYQDLRDPGQRLRREMPAVGVV